MANFEIGPCTLEEYETGREHPLDRHDLSPLSLYTWMVLSREDGAFKHPGRILETDDPDSLEMDEEEASGLYVVRFDILNAGMERIGNSDSLFEDGIYLRESDGSKLILYTDYGQLVVEEGYFTKTDAYGGSAMLASVAEDVEPDLGVPLFEDPQTQEDRQLVRV